MPLSTQPLSIRTDWGLKSMFKISFSNIYIMDANFAGLCANVNNFNMDGIFTSDRVEIMADIYAIITHNLM